MKKALAIFKRDLKRILRNPVALAIVIGIAVVPCLYAWINVMANWDPYENTSDVPVAVVNKDTAVELADMGEICAGDMVVDALKENDQIGWRFMAEDEALEGVRSGTCYAAIVIPNDFTKRLTGILDGKTDKAHLKYYVNEKVNPIAPKVTDTGASTIGNQIDSQFIAKVGEVVSEKLGVALQGVFSDSKETVGKENSILGDVYVSLADVDTRLGDLSTSLKNAQTALTESVNKLDPLQGLGTRVGQNMHDALDRLDGVREDANNLTSQLNGSLGSAAGSISTLSSTASYDIASVAGDVAHAQSQINAAISALENDLIDSKAMVAKLDDALSVVVTIEDDGVKATIADIRRQLSTERDVMLRISDGQAAKLEELKGLSHRLESAAQEVSNLSSSINDKVRNATGALQNTQTSSVTTVLSQINASLDTFARVGGELEAAARLADPVIAQTVSLAHEFAGALDGTDGALQGTRNMVADLAEEVSTLESELAAIRTSQAWSMAQRYASTNPEAVHDFLSAPVDVNEIALFHVENYASGVAPFFTSVALWVGGIALVAIFKLEVDEEEVGKLRPWQAYFGRWLLFVLIGALQAIACCTGDLIIGIQCTHVWAFYLSAIVASFAFVNIIFGLSVAFKHLGKALAFTLIILQVPGSSGMYPIEMMPPFFQAIGPWLPFTYSNNAMREAIGGFYGSNLAYNLGMLLLFVVPSILVGVAARAHLVNVNALFDQRLRDTHHLLVSEPVAMEGNHYRLATVVKALHSPKEYREELDARSAAFERMYPSLVRRGLLLLLLLPLGIFALMLVLDAQLPTIACFVVSLVGIYVFLIVVEYLHDRITHKRALTELSPEELENVLNETLREEVLPSAPVDALIERRYAHARTEVMTTMKKEHDPASDDDDQDVAQRVEIEKGGDAR